MKFSAERNRNMNGNIKNVIMDRPNRKRPKSNRDEGMPSVKQHIYVALI